MVIHSMASSIFAAFTQDVNFPHWHNSSIPPKAITLQFNWNDWEKLFVPPKHTCSVRTQVLDHCLGRREKWKDVLVELEHRAFPCV